MMLVRVGKSKLSFLPSLTSLTNYLLCHEILEIVFVLGWCLLSVCARTLTFHHPEQSLLHKLHWLDHVIRVGVFSVFARALTATLHLPLYLTHLLTYLYKQASSVSSIRVSVRGQGSCLCM